MALNKQIWIDQLMEKFYPEASFINESVDMTENVDYNKINLAEAGVDPAVLRNNVTFPVATSTRTDLPLEIPLNTLDTENTIVRNAEQKELSYNKMESVLRGHRNALQNFCNIEAAQNWAPQSNTAFTPVMNTTGATVGGFKKASFEDFLKLEASFRDLDVDMSKLNVSLTTSHLQDLRNEDLKLYKEILMDSKLFGFKLHTFTKNPLFTAAGVKKPFGSIAGATDSRASIAWVSSEVMKADGTVEMFAKYKDPEQRGDVVGFQKRFVALPIRNKYIGAIVSGV